MIQKKIRLNAAERQSSLTRVKWAESLILQLPVNHEGRNSWLLNYGFSHTAKALRNRKGVEFDSKTQSAELASNGAIKRQY